MFCRYCGKELEDDSRFCSKCGKQLVEDNNVVASTSNNSNSKKEEKFEDTIESYRKRAFPIVKDAFDRFNRAVAVHNIYLKGYTFEKIMIAGLNLIEVYLDYYKGMVKIHGQGNYSVMNKEMEETIATVEDNYIDNKENLDLRTKDKYDRKLSELRTEWRKVKQM